MNCIHCTRCCVLWTTPPSLWYGELVHSLDPRVTDHSDHYLKLTWQAIRSLPLSFARSFVARQPLVGWLISSPQPLPSSEVQPPSHILLHCRHPTMSNLSEPASTVQDSSSTMSILPISQPASPFEELPIEIHITILHQMASPKDLSATLRASPTALGAFLSSRETILASVLERHIPPEIFSHYVAVLTAPNYADFNFVAPLYVSPSNCTDSPCADKIQTASPTTDTKKACATRLLIVKSSGGRNGGSLHITFIAKRSTSPTVLAQAVSRKRSFDGSHPRRARSRQKRRLRFSSNTFSLWPSCMVQLNGSRKTSRHFHSTSHRAASRISKCSASQTLLMIQSSGQLFLPVNR